MKFLFLLILISGCLEEGRPLTRREKTVIECVTSNWPIGCPENTCSNKVLNINVVVSSEEQFRELCQACGPNEKNCPLNYRAWSCFLYRNLYVIHEKAVKNKIFDLALQHEAAHAASRFTYGTIDISHSNPHIWSVDGVLNYCKSEAEN